MSDIFRTCCFTGHRPDKLYGYDLKDRRYMVLKSKLIEVMESRVMKPFNIGTFLSGGAIGFDKLCYDVGVELRDKEGYFYLSNQIAVPFKNQHTRWSRLDKLKYLSMIRSADKVTYVDCESEYMLDDVDCDIYHPIKMQMRNMYMVDHSQVLIACWNGEKGSGTYNCIQYALECSAIELILAIDPNTLKVRELHNSYF